MLPYLLDDPANNSDREDDSLKYLEGETVLYPRNMDAIAKSNQNVKESKGLSSVVRRK